MVPRPKNFNICSVEDCDKLVYAKGMCRPHWWRMFKYGRTHKIQGLIKGDCTVEGCNKKIKGLGFCRNHLYILHKYNINPNEYVKMLKKQEFCCAICGEKETSIAHNSHDKVVKRLAVDHCHKTGKIRKLLCNRCNTVIGRLNEDVNLIQKMINYLTKHNEIS